MERQDEMSALVHAARTAQVESELLLECLQRRLIVLDEGKWGPEAIEAARRVRRLMALGVSIQGVEVAFHMRRQLLDAQRELARLQEQVRQLQEAHAREVARLLRDLAHDAELRES